eukprot:766786-Hanusia_phi.AAC.7
MSNESKTKFYGGGNFFVVIKSRKGLFPGLQENAFLPQVRAASESKSVQQHGDINICSPKYLCKRILLSTLCSANFT